MWILKVLNFISYVVLIIVVPGWFLLREFMEARFVVLFVIIFAIWLNQKTRKLLEDY